MKKKITESQLRDIIAESIQRVIRESSYEDWQDIIYSAPKDILSSHDAYVLWTFVENYPSIWESAWDNVDAYFGGSKEDFISAIDGQVYILPNGWDIEDIYYIAKAQK